MSANLDLHPCKSALALVPDDEVDGVEVGLALSAALDVDEAAVFQLGDGAADGGDVRAHVFSQSFLTREAEVVVPRVAEQECVRGLCVGGQIRIAEDEVGELREAVLRDRI